MADLEDEEAASAALTTATRRVEDAPPEHDAFPMTRRELRLTQWLAALAGLGLVALALVVWLPGDGPTIVRSVERTGTTSRTSEQGHRMRVVHTVVVRAIKTTAGDVRGHAARSAPARTSRRSELLATVLAGSGSVLILLGFVLPRLRGGTGPRGASFQLAAIHLIRRRVGQRIAADSRLRHADPERAVDLALQDVQSQQTRAGLRKALRRVFRGSGLELDLEVDQAVSRALLPVTQRPQVKTGEEHYQGDRFETLDPTDHTLVARVVYRYGDEDEDDYDVLATDIKLRGETAAGQDRIGRIILTHALGNRSLSDEAVSAFADEFEAVIRERYWSLELAQVNAWISQHLDGAGGLLAGPRDA
jgi:hypothetical protein